MGHQLVGLIVGLLYRPVRAERGATAVEYAIMVALIALVIIASVVTLGTSVSKVFGQAASSI